MANKKSSINKKVTSTKNNTSNVKTKKEAFEKSSKASLILKVIILVILIIAIVIGLTKACDKDEKVKDKKDKKPVAVIEDDNNLKDLDDNSNTNQVVIYSEIKQLDYEVTKEESKTETVTEKEIIVSDSTAPVVTGVRDGEVGSSFIINAMDDKTETSNLIVKIDNEDYTLGEEYTINGDHTLVVADEAGNKTIIHFTIAIIVVDGADEAADLNSIIANADAGDIIYLSSNVYENINIDKSIIIRGNDNSSINSFINITNGDVTLDGVNINNTMGAIAYSGTSLTLIKVDTTGSFTLKNSVIEGNDFTAKNAITINNASSVEITGNTFGDSLYPGAVYNYIEFGANTIVKNGTNISNNKFTSSSCTHNQINMYNFEENALININNNYFEKSANALRIANRNNATATINMIGNKYDETDSAFAWAGLFLAQPWDPSVEDFSTITINVENLIGPGGNLMINNVPNTINQIYYTWNTTTTPIVNIR